VNIHTPKFPSPDAKSKTGRVWAIAEDISRRAGRRATRDEVMAAMRAEGGNPNTAATQYSAWKKSFDTRKPVSETSAFIRLTIGEDGRLLIPRELRALMMIGSNGLLTARVENGELRVLSPLAAVRQLQQIIRENDTGQGSPVDELIAERRAEALKE
jgi:bifunctional DNA-binding transcriptional regulator/antitoxin component of YhaV-PrlF toxin-antitoxin module